jgi:hypothetical protein
MTHTFVTLCTLLTLAAAPFAQHDGHTADANNLTGTWNMGLQGGHVIPVALVLKQQEATLTGTLAMPTQNAGQTVDVDLKGSLTSGAFTLAGRVEGAQEPTSIEIKGQLTDEGTIEGTLTMKGASAHAREMPYTAERLKERK